MQVSVNLLDPKLSAVQAAIIQHALTSIGNNFNMENILYIAELSKKPGVNEKFTKLRNNPFVKSLL